MDDSRSEVQILEYLSECLRIFRKRLIQMIKINQKGSVQTLVQAEEHFQKTSDEGKKLVDQFPKVISQFAKLETVFSRFASRVKQIVNNTQLKSTSSEMSNYLVFLSSLLKQSIGSQKYYLILKCMLTICPKTLPNNSVQVKKPEERYYQSQQNTPIKIKSPQYSLINSQRTQNYLDNHEKFNLSLEKQYQLYNGLSLDESEYRKKFFLARQDYRRKDTNLYQDMLFRNRFTQQIFTNYKSDYERYSKKVLAKKNKQKQSPEKTGKFLKQQLTNYTTKESVLKSNNSVKMIQTSMNGNSFKSQQKRIKTENYEKIGLSAGEIITTKIREQNKGNNFFNHRKKFKTHFATCISTDEFFANQKIFQSEKPKICRPGANLVELKKINFLGSKIQLMPESRDHKQILKIDRRKNLCKRTQEHLKRKISIISQPKAISSSCVNTISSNKQKSFTPLLIDYSRLLK